MIILGTVIAFTSQGTSSTIEGFWVYFFHIPGCSHCDEQEPFNKKLANKSPQIRIIYYDATTATGSARLSEKLAELEIEDQLSFPTTIFRNQVFGGWESEETTGRAIEEACNNVWQGTAHRPPVRNLTMESYCHNWENCTC